MQKVLNRHQNNQFAQDVPFMGGDDSNQESSEGTGMFDPGNVHSQVTANLQGILLVHTHVRYRHRLMTLNLFHGYFPARTVRHRDFKLAFMHFMHASIHSIGFLFCFGFIQSFFTLSRQDHILAW